MVVERQDVAQDGEFCLRRTACQASRHNRRGHVAIGILVVLVDADALKAELVREFEFVQIAVIERMA